MIQFHRRKKADVTIGMMKVDMKDINQFGTGIIDSEERIVEWEEKPEVPRTDLASMGIYVFDTDYLLSLLEEDKTEIDFGMHLIPKAIERDNVFAFPFQGYWRDVGTVQAYWEANMDVIRVKSGINPEAWGIRPNPEAENLLADRCPARFASGCEVKRSLISADCIIEGTVINSVLSPGVVVKPGAVVRDSIIFHDCIVEAGARIDLSILDKRVTVGREAVVGSGTKQDNVNRLFPKHLYTGITLIGKEAAVPPKTVIGRNCIVQPNRQPDDFPDLTVKSGETV